MSGKVIGKSLPFGFRGAVSRTPDTVITTLANTGDDPIQYGEPVVFDASTGGVRKIKSTDTASANIVGIAVRRAGQPYADNELGWYYEKGDAVDVLVRGSICVELASDTGIAAKGNVYVYNGAKAATLAAHAAGGIAAAADSSNNDTVQVPNAIFTTGKADANNIAEITILTRSI